MSAFGGLILTNKGRNLQAKAQVGAQLNFTRIAIGDGDLDGTSILDLNALRHEVKSLSITKLKTMTGGKAVVGTTFSNQDITSGFYWRELGVFAQDPELGEILYCYGNSGANAEYIPAGGGPDTIEKSIDVVTIVGNVSSVTASIDQSLIYASQQDLTNIQNQIPTNISQLNNDVGYITQAPVQSVNGKIGKVTLTASDVGAVNKAGDIIKPSADSTTVFQVQKSDGSVVLDVDTTNKRVGIGTNSPGQPLEVNGNIKTTSQFISTVATGTAPLQVSSTTVVSNLNADMTDGIHFRVSNGSLQYNDGSGWKNVMTSIIKSIQRGMAVPSNSATITISAVDTSKAVISLTGELYGGDSYIHSTYLTLDSPTALTIHGIVGSGNAVSWQVVEYV